MWRCRGAFDGPGVMGPRLRGDDSNLVVALHHTRFAAPAISSKIFCGVIGVCAIRTWNGESASSIAEITAAAVGMVLTSPAPLAPSGLSGEGVSLNSVAILGTSVEVGS